MPSLAVAPSARLALSVRLQSARATHQSGRNEWPSPYCSAILRIHLLQVSARYLTYKLIGPVDWHSEPGGLGLPNQSI